MVRHILSEMFVKLRPEQRLTKQSMCKEHSRQEKQYVQRSSLTSWGLKKTVCVKDIMAEERRWAEPLRTLTRTWNSHCIMAFLLVILIW